MNTGKDIVNGATDLAGKGIDKLGQGVNAIGSGFSNAGHAVSSWLFGDDSPTPVAVGANPTRNASTTPVSGKGLSSTPGEAHGTNRN